MTISNYTPEEVLNYVEMPEAASKAMNELMATIDKLKESIASFEDSMGDIEKQQIQLALILRDKTLENHPKLPDLIQVGNAIYKIL